MSAEPTTIPAAESRRCVKPTLVYWHCNIWWPLVEGPLCPAEHDTPIYDYRGRYGRKRRVWMCDDGEGEIAYPSRKKFLAHEEEGCYATV